jgi:hypothetical protein
MAVSVSLQQKLQSLNNCGMRASENHALSGDGQASVNIAFSDGTKLRADYWRLSKNGKALLSSFDHKQAYGLPAPMDAISCLKDELQNATVVEAWHDPETGDLLFVFSNGAKLQVLNLNGYEIWQISFPDGTKEYSNLVR